jgi:hypothetical protein
MATERRDGAPATHVHGRTAGAARLGGFSDGVIAVIITIMAAPLPDAGSTWAVGPGDRASQRRATLVRRAR